MVIIKTTQTQTKPNINIKYNIIENEIAAGDFNSRFLVPFFLFLPRKPYRYHCGAMCIHQNTLNVYYMSLVEMKKEKKNSFWLHNDGVRQFKYWTDLCYILKWIHIFTIFFFISLQQNMIWKISSEKRKKMKRKKNECKYDKKFHRYLCPSNGISNGVHSTNKLVHIAMWPQLNTSCARNTPTKIESKIT